MLFNIYFESRNFKGLILLYVKKHNYYNIYYYLLNQFVKIPPFPETIIS